MSFAISGFRVWRRGYTRAGGPTVEQHVCPADGGWHHLAVTLDRGWLTTYLDGRQVSAVLVGWRAKLRRPWGSLLRTARRVVR